MNEYVELACYKHLSIKFHELRRNTLHCHGFNVGECDIVIRFMASYFYAHEFHKK